MNVSSLVVGAFDENCWVLHDPARAEVVLIDPGEDAVRICAEIERLGARLVAVWLTHAHLDHIGAISGVRRVWPGVPVHLHPADLPIYVNGDRAAAYYGLPFEQPEQPERELAEGQLLEFAGERFTVRHLPGHSPGHVAFIGAEHCFSGDVLFAGSVGRSDLPLSDPAALAASLERMMALPATLRVHPGHGPSTTIAAEAAGNPFLTGAARVLGSRG